MSALQKWARFWDKKNQQQKKKWLQLQVLIEIIDLNANYVDLFVLSIQYLLYRSQ
jgi:hypothetical protein